MVESQFWLNNIILRGIASFICQNYDFKPRGDIGLKFGPEIKINKNSVKQKTTGRNSINRVTLAIYDDISDSSVVSFRTLCIHDFERWLWKNFIFDNFLIYQQLKHD